MSNIEKSEIQIQKASNIVEAIEKGTQLSILRKNNENTLVKVMSSLILRFQSYLNIEKKMNDDQIVVCAQSIIEQYWGYKIEEFYLFFKDAAIGKYGKIYNRLDMMVIFEMLAKYDEEREEKLIESHTKRKSINKSEVSFDFPVKISEKIKKLESSVKFDYKDPEYLKYKSSLFKSKHTSDGTE